MSILLSYRRMAGSLVSDCTLVLQSIVRLKAEKAGLLLDARAAGDRTARGTVIAAVLCALVSFGAENAWAGRRTATENRPKLIDVTELRVIQGVHEGLSSRLAPTSAEFRKALPLLCRSSEQIPVAAPLIAAVGGIVVDWIFARMTAALEKRLQARLAAHTTSYGHDPEYGLLDAQRWDAGQSCIVVQRVKCSVEIAVGEEPPTTCSTGEAKVSVALLLRDENTYFLALPVAFEVRELRTQHVGGRATAAASLRLDSLTYDSEAGGGRWTSGEIPVFAMGFTAQPSAKGLPAQASGFAHTRFDISEGATDFTDPSDRAHPAWGHAIRIPMMPASSRDAQASRDAFVVTIAEVGASPKWLEDLSAFITAKKDDLADALSTAVKKKLNFTD